MGARILQVLWLRKKGKFVNRPTGASTIFEKEPSTQAIQR